MSRPSARRLFVCPPRDLSAQDPARGADCPLVLSRQPHDVQPVAGLSGGAVAGHAAGSGGRGGEAAPSLAAAADAVRRDAVLLPGAMRWVRRRVARVHRALTAVRGLCPERFVHCAAEVGALRTRLGTTAVLVHLRELGAEQLPALPAPVGFFPRAQTSGNRVRGFQHRVGPDPPVPGV